MTHRLFAFALLALVAAPVIGQAPPATATPPVPRAKFLAQMETGFQRADTNKDNKLTRAEIEAQQQREFATVAGLRAQAVFKRLDTDNSGQLSMAEFSKLTQNMPKPDAQPYLTKLDANKDGSISAAEFRSGAQSDFDRIDTNKDGTITPAELQAARPKK